MNQKDHDIRVSRKAPPPPLKLDDRVEILANTRNAVNLGLKNGDKLTTMGADMTAQTNELQSLNRWSMGRDIIIILLLVGIAFFLVWRAYWVQSAIHTCAQHDGVTIIDPDSDRG